MPIIVLLKRGKLDKEILSIIWSHGHQLKHLEIRALKLRVHARPGPLPSLETLTFRGLGAQEGWGYWGFYIRRVFDLLSPAPNLIEWFFCDVHIVNDVGISDDKLVFPNMRRLMFGERETRPGRGGDKILKYVSLP